MIDFSTRHGLALCFLLAAMLLCGHSSARTFDKDNEVTVLGVFDGDSITVRHQADTFKVSLFGVDAPENNQPWGEEAKLFLENLVLSKVVILRTLYLDRYDREVAIVTLPTGEVVQEMMLEGGHTMVYPKYCDTPQCDEWYKMERRARNNKIGLWQHDDITEPWVWKRSRFYAE